MALEFEGGERPQLGRLGRAEVRAIEGTSRFVRRRREIGLGTLIVFGLVFVIAADDGKRETVIGATGDITEAGLGAGVDVAGVVPDVASEVTDRIGGVNVERTSPADGETGDEGEFIVDPDESPDVSTPAETATGVGQVGPSGSFYSLGVDCDIDPSNLQTDTAQSSFVQFAEVNEGLDPSDSWTEIEWIPGAEWICPQL